MLRSYQGSESSELFEVVIGIGWQQLLVILLIGGFLIVIPICVVVLVVWIVTKQKHKN